MARAGKMVAFHGNRAEFLAAQPGNVGDGVKCEVGRLRGGINGFVAECSGDLRGFKDVGDVDAIVPYVEVCVAELRGGCSGIYPEETWLWCHS